VTGSVRVDDVCPADFCNRYARPQLAALLGRAYSRMQMTCDLLLLPDTDHLPRPLRAALVNWTRTSGG
jgi:hypothetical protein